jgi:hypothetical protein
MMRYGDLDYAQGRLGARYGERPDEAAWRSIGVIRDFPALLDAARQGPFRRWVAGLAPDAQPHAIEAAMRSSWRALCGEVCSWMPAEWQPAVECACSLADLPIVAYLARGEPRLAWMSDYPKPAPHADPDPRALLAAWRDEWQRQVPAPARRDPVLRELGRLLRSSSRRELAARLPLLYRRALLEPSAAFVFLALSALDMERLRGELLRRALFPHLRMAA